MKRWRVGPGERQFILRALARETAALWILALPLLASAGCGAAPRPKPQRVPVTVTIVERREVPFALVATGTVEAIRTSSVGSQVGGVVTRILFREGDEVGRGRILIQLDPRPFRNALDQAVAALAKDRAQARAARLDAERARALVERKLVSDSEWDQKRAAADSWLATVAADSAAERIARLELEYSSIRAPIAGRTGRLLVHEGDYVKAATSDPLVTINQTRPVRVAFTVPVDAVPLVQRYRSARPRIYVRPAGADSATAIQGRLVFVDNAVDAASGTLLLKGEFDNRDGRLVPGQFVDVRFVLFDQPNAVVVPAPAVTSGQQGSIVYVVNADSTVTPRPVQIERSADELAVVRSGLEPGETVVLEGQLRLSPGARVVVRSPGGTSP